MTRVLLFVQTGDGRPKCSWSGRAGVPYYTSGALLECIDAVRDGRFVHHGSLECSAARADRWWLVECETAEDGRRVILCTAGACEHYKCEADDCAPGRILASGGKP